MFYLNKEREIDLCKRKREGREKIYLDKTEK